MKILVINGPNLNMLGVREPSIYGEKTYADLVRQVEEYALSRGAQAVFCQSNSEGDIVSAVQNALGKFDAIIINAAAYSHTSIAILDALKAVSLPTVNVHLTDISAREEFRHNDFIALYSQKTITGKGFKGYEEAVDFLVG